MASGDRRGCLAGLEATPRNTNLLELSAVLLSTQAFTGTAGARVAMATLYASHHGMQAQQSMPQDGELRFIDMCTNKPSLKG